MMGLIKRRVALAGLAGAIASRTARAAPAELPDKPTLLVAGPQGGTTDDWAAAIAAPMGRGLQLGSGVAWQNLGGPDGVTAANQFQARIVPDGATALLAPGATLLGWLTGDTRVRFDVGRWTALWGTAMPIAVVSRGPLARGRRLRAGVHSVAGPELTGLLALHALGREIEPVPLDPALGVPLARPDLDLLFLRGTDLRARQAPLAQRGWSPVFGSGAITAEGSPVRDPSYPELPTFWELIGQEGRNSGPELMAALGAVSAAATLDVSLVLPQQTPAALVAWWRQGCAALASAPEVQAQAARSAVRPIGAGVIAAHMQRITVDASVMLELRRWLADRYHWQPS